MPENPGTDRPEPDHPTLPVWKKLLFTALLVLFALAAIEGGLRLAGAGGGFEIDAPMAYEQLRGHMGRGKMWSDQDLLEANFASYQDDRLRLWRMKSGLDLYVKNFLLPEALRGNRRFHLRTDEEGFPPSAVADAGPGRRRVLCLGDSNTFGWGVDHGQAWPEQLHRILERKAPGRYSVRNLGQPGYSSDQGVALWGTLESGLEPAVVIVGYGFNDGVKAPVADREAMKFRHGALGWARHSLSRTATVRSARRLFGRRASAPDPASLVRRVSALRYVTNLETLARKARDHGAEVIFLSVQNKYPDAMAGAAAQLGAPRVDADRIAADAREALDLGGGPEAWRKALTDRFSEAFLDREPRWWVRADVAHYNRFVHGLVAEAVAGEILE